jgi:hypothetical protein
MAIYIKVSLEGEKTCYYDTLDGAVTTLKYMAEEKAYSSKDEHKYVFEAVEMSDEDFEALPEFQGF